MADEELVLKEELALMQHCVSMMKMEKFICSLTSGSSRKAFQKDPNLACGVRLRSLIPTLFLLKQRCCLFVIKIIILQSADYFI